MIYLWNGKAFDIISSYPTYGGTASATFTYNHKMFLAVSNCLSPSVRFNTVSMIYRLDLEA
ncbi:MAG: hypothetical protein JSR85_04545 [Proteobacteria bacterium]|nr:hypothetical protein [Pseudomonadota bacterium]